MRRLVAFCLGRPITTLTIHITLLGLGGLAITRLPLNSMPQSDRPRVSVRIPYENADPHQVEMEITRPVEEALATLRGVDVRVILPKKPDSYPVWLASFWYIEELADDDVRFYHYDEGFMHQKVMLVDDYWSAVGTANFDNRSFRLNFEVTAVVANRPFAKEMEGMLEADMERSVPFDPSRLKEMSFFRRLAVRTARLLSPIL